MPPASHTPAGQVKYLGPSAASTQVAISALIRRTPSPSRQLANAGHAGCEYVAGVRNTWTRQIENLTVVVDLDANAVLRVARMLERHGVCAASATPLAA